MKIVLILILLLSLILTGSYALGSVPIAKAYFCGYVRGMKFVADRQGIQLGPIPIDGCEQFDYLDSKT